MKLCDMSFGINPRHSSLANLLTNALAEYSQLERVNGKRLILVMTDDVGRALSAGRVLQGNLPFEPTRDVSVSFARWCCCCLVGVRVCLRTVITAQLQDTISHDGSTTMVCADHLTFTRWVNIQVVICQIGAMTPDDESTEAFPDDGNGSDHITIDHVCIEATGLFALYFSKITWPRRVRRRGSSVDVR